MNIKGYRISRSFIALLCLLVIVLCACSAKNTENTLYYSDGSKKYVGDLIDGVPHGYGIQYREDGSIEYEGDWRNGAWHGYGLEYNYRGKLFYEGDFVNGKEHGKGRLYYEDGDIAYEGDFLNGEFHGMGIFYGFSPLLYPGKCWHDGRTENLTRVLVVASQDKPIIYEGEWRYGVYDGQGTRYFIEGGIQYEGEWRDGMRDGVGTEYNEDGSIWFSGEWKDGEEYNGRGCMILNNNLIEYEIINGEFHTIWG